MIHPIATAHAVLAAMASGMTSKQAAEAHNVGEHWADNLVVKPPQAVRDQPWYRKLRDEARVHRATRSGAKASSARRRV